MSYRFACHQIELSFHRNKHCIQLFARYFHFWSQVRHNFSLIPIHNRFLFCVRLYYSQYFRVTWLIYHDERDFKCFQMDTNCFQWFTMNFHLSNPGFKTNCFFAKYFSHKFQIILHTNKR